MNIFGDEWHSLMIEVFTASFVDSDPSSTGGLFSCELETLSSWNLFDNAKLLTETDSRHLVPERKCTNCCFL